MAKEDKGETLRFLCVFFLKDNANEVVWNLGKRMAPREIEGDVENFRFFLIGFGEGCFSLLTLFHLNKKNVLVTCNKILLNITAKITLGCKA